MKKLRTAQGFTVIELLIATVVFSLVLLVVTTAIVQFSRMYYKGATTSRTQAVARNLMNDVSQTVQFAGGSGTPASPTTVSGITSRCIGDRTYTYKLNQQVPTNPDSTHHGLVVTSGSCISSTGAFPSGTEMLDTNMRLVDLQVNQLGNNLFQVVVVVAYGDTADLTYPTATTAKCKLSLVSGGQFCAVASLTTTVAKRVN